jgi:hypothetical protein
MFDMHLSLFISVVYEEIENPTKTQDGKRTTGQK